MSDDDKKFLNPALVQLIELIARRVYEQRRAASAEPTLSAPQDSSKPDEADAGG